MCVHLISYFPLQEESDVEPSSQPPPVKKPRTKQKKREATATHYLDWSTTSALILHKWLSAAGKMNEVLSVAMVATWTPTHTHTHTHGLIKYGWD